MNPYRAPRKRTEDMKREKSLETILVLVLTLVAIPAYRAWRLDRHEPIYLVAAILLGAVGLFLPAIAQVIHDLWMKLAQAMGWVMSKVLLTALFYLVLVPLAWVVRRTGAIRRSRKGEGTYYRTRNIRYDANSMRNTW